LLGILQLNKVFVPVKIVVVGVAAVVVLVLLGAVVVLLLVSLVGSSFHDCE